jgi:hypothetical protein
MTSLRFSFPVAPPAPAFVALPAVVGFLVPPTQLAAVQVVYQAAWERTRAVLTPSRVEKLYRVSVN